MPFAFADSSGQPSDYSVGLCKRVAAGLQLRLNLPTLEVNWVPITLAKRVEMVNAGKIDLECATGTNTSSRRTIGDWSLITWVDGGSFLSRGTEFAKGVADLNGRKVGVVKDTMTETALGDAISRAAVRASHLRTLTACVHARRGHDRRLRGRPDGADRAGGRGR